MSELAAIRAGIKANLDPLNTFDPLGTGDNWIEVSAYAIPDPGFRVPIIMVWGIDQTAFDVAFQQGGQEVDIRVRAVSGTMLEVPPQEVLDLLLMGAASVKELLESDRTLSGTVEDSFVATMTGHTEFPLGPSRVLGADWIVHAVLTGT